MGIIYDHDSHDFDSLILPESFGRHTVHFCELAGEIIAVIKSAIVGNQGNRETGLF